MGRLLEYTNKTLHPPSPTGTYLNPGQVSPEADVGLLHVRGPRGEQVLPELLIKVTSVRHKGRGEEDVATDGGHLALESLTASVPAFPLVPKAAQEGFATLHLQSTRKGKNYNIRRGLKENEGETGFGWGCSERWDYIFIGFLRWGKKNSIANHHSTHNNKQHQ